MTDAYFNGDTYDTPDDTPRKFVDKLLLGSRWYFAYGFIKEILKGRSIAVKGLYDRWAWAQSSLNIAKLIEGCGGRIHLKGLENIKKCQGPVVFISNHMSTLETFVLPCIIAPHMEVTFAVKESLVKSAIFGPVMRSRDPIVVKRQNPREDLKTVMTKGKELLQNGVSVIIFPQSTRTVEFIPEEFNTLGVKLAKDAGVQVVPIAVKTDFWGNGKLIKELGPINRNNHVYMSFGEPLSISGNGKEEHKYIIKYITDNLINWNRISF